jgi:Peptidase U49
MNRIDVSNVVDRLLRGAAPERANDLAALWGTGPDRVHLNDAGAFDIGAIFGVIQATEITLREIWLLSFAAWRAIQAYSDIIWLLAQEGRPFVRDQVAAMHEQAEADAAFDAALAKARELRENGDLDSFAWPTDIPKPAIDNQFGNPQDEAAFHLACIAGAYIFLHEIQHVLFQRSGNAPRDPLAEELECDRFARHFLFDRIDEYARQHGVPVEQVRSKRALGIAVAKTILLELTPLAQWEGSAMHPPVAARIKSFLGDLGGPVTEHFWISVASFLAAMCRVRGRLPAQIAFKSPQEVALALADCL